MRTDTFGAVCWGIGTVGGGISILLGPEPFGSLLTVLIGSGSVAFILFVLRPLVRA